MLALSAGGSRLAFHIGAIRGLYKKDEGNVEYTHFSGISAGALVAAEVCQYKSNEDYFKRTNYMADKLMNGKQIVSPWAWKWLGSTFNALYSLVFHKSLFKSDLPSLVNQEYDSSNIGNHVLSVGAKNMTTGEYQTFKSNEDPNIMSKAISASASVPLIFPSVQIDQIGTFQDGAMSHIIPVKEIAEFYNKEHGNIDIILAYPLEYTAFLSSQIEPSKWSLFNQGQKTISVEMYDNLQSDISFLSALFDISVVKLTSTHEHTLKNGKKLRFYYPKKSKYTSFTDIKLDDIQRMITQGERIVEE